MKKSMQGSTKNSLQWLKKHLNRYVLYVQIAIVMHTCLVNTFSIKGVCRIGSTKKAFAQHAENRQIFHKLEISGKNDLYRHSNILYFLLTCNLNLR